MTLLQAVLIAWPALSFPLGCITGRIIRNGMRPRRDERDGQSARQDRGEGLGFHTIHRSADK